MVDLNPCRLKCKTIILVIALIVVSIVIVTIFLKPTKSDIRKEKAHKPPTRDHIDLTEKDYKIESQFYEERDKYTYDIEQERKSQKSTKRKYCNIYTTNLKRKNAKCVPFNTRIGQTPICIYDPKEDKMISSYINDYGTWEPDLLNLTAEILEGNPGMAFLDLGCNIGAFTIFVAALGRKVTAVDILSSALDNLHESLNRGQLEKNVTLLLNAVSNARGQLKVSIVSENIGGSHVIETPEKKKGGKDNEKRNPDPQDIVVDSVLLDDLLEVIDSEELFIKMDIEGNEWRALEKGKDLFQKINVRFLLMEWMLHKGKTSGKNILNFLVRNGFLPYLDYRTRHQLEINRSQFWPDNVLWAKR